MEILISESRIMADDLEKLTWKNELDRMLQEIWGFSGQVIMKGILPEPRIIVPGMERYF